MDQIMIERGRTLEAAENARQLTLFKLEHQMPTKQDIDLNKFPIHTLIDTPNFDEILQIRDECK